MKTILLISALLLLALVGYSQSITSDASGVLLANSSSVVKPADCIGEWSSGDGYYLTLYENNKAVWKDDSHIYYMTWRSESASQSDNIKISLSGTDFCKHKNFYLSETDNGIEIIEDQSNAHMRFSKELTATLQ